MGKKDLKERYNSLTRIVRKDTRKTKRDYEMRVARNAKSNPKGILRIYMTKNKNRIGPLKKK